MDTAEVLNCKYQLLIVTDVTHPHENNLVKINTHTHARAPNHLFKTIYQKKRREQVVLITNLQHTP